MKKIACLIAAALLLSLMGSAWAEVRADYQDGIITVTTDESGIWEILLDGENTYRWVGTGMPVNTFEYPLEEGKQHLVLLISLQSDGAVGSNYLFWAGPEPTEAPTPVPTEEPAPAPTEEPAPEPTLAPEATEEPTEAPAAEVTQEPAIEATEEPAPTQEPTAEPPKGPVKILSAVYENRNIQFEVSGLRGYAEIWVDGKSIRRSVKENGLNSIEMTLSTGNHTLMLYSPLVNEADEISFQAEFEPDPRVASPEALGDILKDEAGAPIPFEAAYITAALGSTLVVRPDAEEKSQALNEASLYLSDSQIRSLMQEGFAAVRLALDEAQLQISLKDVGTDWFSTDKAIWYYVFTVHPLSAVGAQVTVSAQTSSTERIYAERILGVSMIRNGQETEFSQNGVY